MPPTQYDGGLPPLTLEKTEAQLRWERRARELLQRIAIAAAAAGSWREAMQTAVDEVCRATGWPIGHVLSLSESGSLVSAHIWCIEAGERYAAFREISDSTPFAIDVGLPGRVLATGR